MMIGKKQLIEAIGVISVVASLVFVGIQLFLDRRLALTEIYSSRAESLKSDYRTSLESEAYLEAQVALWDRGDRPFYWTSELEQHIDELGLNYREVFALILRHQITNLHYDNVYFQYNQGLLAEESWVGFLIGLEGLLRTDPLARVVFSTYPRGLESVIREILSDSE